MASMSYAITREVFTFVVSEFRRFIWCLMEEASKSSYNNIGQSLSLNYSESHVRLVCLFSNLNRLILASTGSSWENDSYYNDIVLCGGHMYLQRGSTAAIGLPVEMLLWAATTWHVSMCLVNPVTVLVGTLDLIKSDIHGHRWIAPEKTVSEVKLDSTRLIPPESSIWMRAGSLEYARSGHLDER